MSAAVPGTAVTSANPNTTTNTSLSVALGSTTIGDLNVIRISGLSSGTGINPTMTTPTGWTKKFEQMSASGTPSTFVGVYYRFYQAGDPSSVTFSWTNTGQMIAICTPYGNADTTTPMPYSNSAAKSGTSTTFSISGTTGTDQGFLSYGGANKTGTAWSGLSDNADGQIGLTSSATMVARETAAEVAGGTAYTKTMTGSNTSIGVMWAYVIKGAASGSTVGSAAVGATSTIPAPTLNTDSTVSPAVIVEASTIPAPGVSSGANATISASLVPETSSVPSPSVSATPSLLTTWLSNLPYYVAHRGGDNDWVEMTRDAYTHAIANGATAINIDAVRCSTGEFVASHDLTTGRVFGTNFTIGSTSWATLSGLTTSTGGFPIEKVADLLATFTNVIVFVENKGNSSDDSAFLDMLDAAGGNGRIVVKQYYTAATVSTDAHARNYTTWGYYFTADVANLAATQSRWDLLGLDYTDTSSADWTSIKSYGKKVLGHVIPSAAGATQAFNEGADGIMTGKVLGVIPGSSASVPGASVLATAAIPIPAEATGETVGAIAILAQSAIPAPVEQTGSSAQLVAIQSSSAIPSPTAATGESISTVAPLASSTLPTPALSSGMTASPLAIQPASSINPPAVGAGAGVSPTRVPGTSAMNQPTVSSGVTVAPVSTSEAAQIPLPSLSTSMTILGAVIGGSSNIYPPSLSTGESVSPVAVPETSQIPQSNTGSTQNATATGVLINSQASLFIPAIQTGESVSTILVSASTDILPLSASSGATGTSLFVAGSTNIPVPGAQTGSAAAAAIVASFIAITTPAISSGSSASVDAVAISAQGLPLGPGVVVPSGVSIQVLAVLAVAAVLNPSTYTFAAEGERIVLRTSGPVTITIDTSDETSV